MTLSLLAAVALSHAEVEIMHGAGTSNPSKFFWQALELMTERSRMPLHLTYRAVGSSTGMAEFVGSTNNYTALNDFGAGDVPMKASLYADLQAHGRTMLHVPFAMGGIGVFHSVPTANLGVNKELDLTGCLLARIFSGEITTWNHPDILAINPDMTYTGKILVTHRKLGSSSTAGFTSYLEGKCPDSWSLGSGSTIVWPADTNAAEGSGDMTAYIQANPGAIGYIDAGHGHSVGLSEIALQNKDGNYLTTAQANIAAAGEQALAATPSVMPTDPTADFSAVNLYDLPGPDTWPITMISYFYLNQDISTMDPVTAGLLMYFVEFILSADGQALATEWRFVPLPKAVLDSNTAALATVIKPAGMTEFITESSTLKQRGAALDVFSKKRRNFNEYRGTANAGSIATLKAAATAAGAPICIRGTCYDIETVQLFGIIGIAIGGCGFLLALLACICATAACCKQRTTKPRSVEIPARDLTAPPKSGDAV